MQFSYNLVSFGKTGEVAYEANENIATPRSQRDLPKASIYDIGNRSETGDLLIFIPRSEEDVVVHVGVICNKKRRTRGAEIYLLTENGSFEMLPFSVSASRYYNIVFALRRVRADIVTKLYVERALQPVQNHDVYLPFDFARDNSDAFNGTVLKVLLQGKDVKLATLPEDVGKFYEAVLEAVFLHQS